MNHRGGIFDALAVRPAVFLHDCHHFLVMFLARPIALEFEQHLQSGKGHGASLLNAANRGVVGGLARKSAESGLAYPAKHDQPSSLFE